MTVAVAANPSVLNQMGTGSNGNGYANQITEDYGWGYQGSDGNYYYLPGNGGQPAVSPVGIYTIDIPTPPNIPGYTPVFVYHTHNFQAGDDWNPNQMGGTSSGDSHFSDFDQTYSSSLDVTMFVALEASPNNNQNNILPLTFSWSASQHDSQTSGQGLGTGVCPK